MHHRNRTVAAALFLGLSGLVSACSSPAPPPKEAPAPKPLTAEERVKWYQDCWADFNEKKWEAFKACYGDSATSEQMGYGKPSVTGAEEIVAASQDFSKSFPDGRGEAQLILVNGNHVASVQLLKGTNTGPLTGPDGKETPATSKSIGLLFGHAIDVFGASPKVVKELGVMDGVTFATQLGLSKAPGHPLMEKGAASPTIVIAKSDEAESKNLEAERMAFEAWNKHDAAGNDAFIADDAVLHDQSQPKDTNKKQNSDLNKGFWKGFSDSRLNTSAMWAAGDYVTIIGRFEGTSDGSVPSMGLKKTGKKVSVPFLEIDRLEAGKIKEVWFFFDSALFASQLAPTPAK